MKRLATLVPVAACLLLGSLASAPATLLAAGKGHTPAPSFNVLGFGINRLFVAKGTTVKSASQCDAIVGADGPLGSLTGRGALPQFLEDRRRERTPSDEHVADDARYGRILPRSIGIEQLVILRDRGHIALAH